MVYTGHSQRGMLIVIAIVVGLQTVRVVLMSVMLVAPATTARQWTERPAA